MLMAHPLVLRNLVEEYEALAALNATEGTPEARRRMDDLAYTLCVSTGTRDVAAALAAAHRQLRSQAAAPARPAAAASRVTEPAAEAVAS